MRDIELPFSLKGALQGFTRDLTAAAITDELEPVRCRDNEIDRVITTLLRQSKNNPVLVGEAGVGKTAVVEGLAQRAGAGSVPLSLKPVRILSLSHIDLIAGTSFRGQYEKRLQAVISEATADPNVILFIDELHNLIGAGSAIGAPMDAANMLKPALASGQLRVIGATTEIEYERFIRSDAALERRFQPVFVRELGREESLEVLRARRTRLEMHHLVAISDEALAAAVDTSVKYLPDRRQPDRSIDLLDESCARLRMRQPVDLAPAIVELKAERDRLIAVKRESIREMLAVAEARGNPLERFSRGTFKMFEAMGLGVEKILTGQTTPRRPLPVP
ncbi:MAG TPA: AAA family ATPase, partial [Blastocatellia bacterium]|nr:AAA family ATPase [Blastocatellia bacterium]